MFVSDLSNKENLWFTFEKQIYNAKGISDHTKFGSGRPDCLRYRVYNSITDIDQRIYEEFIIENFSFDVGLEEIIGACIGSYKQIKKRD